MQFIPIVNSTKLAIVDDDDYNRVNVYNWYLAGYHHGRGYVHASVDGIVIGLGPYIIGKAPDGREVDHIDRDPFNNQKSNLRYATRSQNKANAIQRTGKAGYRGVTKHRDRWAAQITVNKKHIHLGVFLTREEAAEAYNLGAIKYFGEFAVLNEIKK